MATRQSRTAQNLHNYAWRGINNDGSRGEGMIEAPSVKSARLRLRSQGISPKKIVKQRTPLFSKDIKHEDIVIFSRQLGTMIKSGIPLVQALEAVAQGSAKPSVARLVNDIRHGIETGDNLSTVLRRHPKYFDRLYCGLIAVGEESGSLDIILGNISSHLEKTASLRKKVKGAMRYPTIVLTVGLVIVAGLLIKIVPVFQEIFASFDAELPWITQRLLDTSQLLQNHFLWVIGAVLAITLLIMLSYRSIPKFHHLIDRIKLRIPIFGNLLRKSILARISRTIAIMFRAGIPMVNTLRTVSQSAGNDVYSTALEHASREVATGRQLEPVLRETKVFPGLILQMVRTGEETGEIDNMLNHAADFYEDEVDTAVDSITTLIEPILIVALGIIVGVVIIALYLPIFKLASLF